MSWNGRTLEDAECAIGRVLVNVYPLRLDGVHFLHFHRDKRAAIVHGVVVVVTAQKLVVGGGGTAFCGVQRMHRKQSVDSEGNDTVMDRVRAFTAMPHGGGPTVSILFVVAVVHGAILRVRGLVS